MTDSIYDFKFRKSKKAIWWLSVDNHFQHSKIEVDFSNEEIIHLYQSHYAKKFLINSNAKNICPLYDYLNEKYVQAEEEQDQFLFDELHEGYETLDTGYDYGQLPQNINYQGDDENPDFFQDNNIKLIPKRL